MATVRSPAVVRPSDGVRFVTAIVDQIATAASAIYTCPSNHIGVIKTCTLSNANAAARNVTLQISRVSASGTPLDIILDADAIEGNSVIQFFDLGHLNATDILQAFASAASSVDVTLNIEEYQFQSNL